MKQHLRLHKTTRKKVSRTYFLIFIFALIFSSFRPATDAFSAENQHEGDAFDAVFVLDTSYSMNHADPDKISSELFRMFMDLSDAGRTRIGYIAYNHQIVASRELTPMSVASNKTKLKQEIEALRRTGYTDLGLGLKAGGNLLNIASAGDRDNGSKPFMVLLSDGGTDFGPNASSGRTEKDSAKDIEAAIKKARQDGYPIYTIGLNHDGTVNPDELERIASETGGTSYITSSAADLPEIFNRIFAVEMRSVLMPIAAVTATGQLQEVQVDIPNSSMKEANLILLSEHPLKEAQLHYSSENIRMFKSGTYTLIKVKQPEKGKAQIKFRGTSGDLIKINLLGSYALEAEAKITDDKPVKGKPVHFEASLITPAGEPVTDYEVYASMTAELAITNKSSNETVNVKMDYRDGRYYAEHIFPDSAAYEWNIRMNGPSFYREGGKQEQWIQNSAPIVSGSQDIHVVKEDGESSLKLEELFTDENGDPLTYQISEANSEKVKAGLSDGILTITPLNTGESEITVTATDPEGAEAKAVLKVSVSSKYTVLIWSAAGALAAILLGAGLYLWLRPKPAFTGKLEGYFLATASGSEVPVKYWALTSFQSRKITLLDLFRSLDVNEPLPEAAQIVFTPAKGGKLKVKHMTRCSLVRNRTPILKNKQEILEYNDKLYITFEDGVTEIELRYKPIKPSTNIFIRSGGAEGQTS